MESMNPHLLSRCLVIGACLLALGCGGASKAGRKPVYSVSGKITMSGGPLPGASVSFAPLDGQPVAVGRTNDQGEYTLTTYDAGDGAAAGRYAVVVSKPTAVAAASGEDEHSVDPYAEVAGSHSAQARTDAGGGVPDLYTSSTSTPLKAEVTSGGENRFDFEL
jgi:hypothetical protein